MLYCALYYITIIYNIDIYSIYRYIDIFQIESYPKWDAPGPLVPRTNRFHVASHDPVAVLYNAPASMSF